MDNNGQFSNSNFGNPTPIASPGGGISSNPQSFPQPQYQPSIISSGTGDIVLPVTPKKSQKPLIITLAIIFLAAILGFGAWWYFGQNSIQQFTPNDYVEYFIYGTENGRNIINDDSFDIPIDEYAASHCDVEYCNKLVEKFDTIKFNDEQTKKYQRDLLLFYVISSKVLYDDQLDISYEITSDDSLLASSYGIMASYIDDANEENYKSLRKQNQLVYQILAKSLNVLYVEEEK